jgi:hypothetical protein
MFKEVQRRGGLGRARVYALSVVVVTALILLAGCSVINALTEKNKDEIEVPKAYSEALDGLLPDMPATWSYMGIGEYGSQMSLGEIVQMQTQKIYRIYGEVEDMSAGALSEDFNFSVTYVVYEDRIEQIKEGKMLLDSDFDRMTLIKLPLEVGTVWEETVTDEEGKSMRMQGQITDMTTEDDKAVYTIKYEVLGSDYYELRKIKEDEGIISFEKPIFYDGEMFPVQYGLNSLNREQTLIVKERSEEEGNSAKLDDQVTLIELDVLPEEESVQVIDEVVKQELEGLIYSFNEAWVHFANEKNMGVLDYVTGTGEAYDIIQRFPAGTMTLTFERIDITDMRYEKDHANLYVHEIIKKVTEEKTEMLEYFWLYDIRKVEGEWRIHSYVDQP